MKNTIIHKFYILPAVLKAAAGFIDVKRGALSPGFYADRGGVYLVATDSAALFAYRVANNPAGIDAGFVFGGATLKKVARLTRGASLIAVELYPNKIIFSAGGESVEAERLTGVNVVNWRRAIFGVTFEPAYRPAGGVAAAFLRDRLARGITPAAFRCERLARALKSLGLICVSTRLIPPRSTVEPLLIISEDTPELIAAVMPCRDDAARESRALDATAAAFDLED